MSKKIIGPDLTQSSRTDDSSTIRAGSKNQRKIPIKTATEEFIPSEGYDYAEHAAFQKWLLENAEILTKQEKAALGITDKNPKIKIGFDYANSAAFQKYLKEKEAVIDKISDSVTEIIEDDSSEFYPGYELDNRENEPNINVKKPEAKRTKAKSDFCKIS